MGFRPKLGDGLPVIGEKNGVLVAGGHYRNGILLAPVTAQIIVSLLDGEAPEPYLEAFSPHRDTEKKRWKQTK